MKKRDTKKSLITFFIFTFNEAHRIEYPIKNFLPYGDVVVVDNYSTDTTSALAASLGARVIKYKNNGVVETVAETEYLFKKIKTDWVFWGFADIMVPNTCLDKYIEIIQTKKYKAVIQKKKTFLFDTKHEYLPSYATVNLFKKDSLDFSNDMVHQMGRFQKEVKADEIYYMPPLDEYSIYHYSTHTISDMLRQFFNYHGVHAEQISKKHLGRRLLLAPSFYFFYNYFFAGAFRYGIQGFLVAVLYAIYQFMVYARAYEISNHINRVTIEEKFQKGKEFLLKNNPHSNVFYKLWGYSRLIIIAWLYKKIKFTTS